MKLAIISDIHGNLEALKSVLEDIENQKPRPAIVCLGDIVGYGAEPNECVELIMKYSLKTVIGNHDHGVLHLSDTAFFNIYAKIAIEWTAGVLSGKTEEFLNSLAYTKVFDNLTLVHASPMEPVNWGYIRNFADAENSFESFHTQLCIVGHTHIPKLYIKSKGEVCSPLITLQNIEKALINVGSVGQPRDGNPDASYVIFDTTERSLQFRRISYDINKTAKKMLDAGLPMMLCERLFRGR